MPQAHPTLKEPKSSEKSLDEIDIFHLMKLDHLTEIEKHSRLSSLWRLALIHFINLDLPELLTPADLKTLDQLTQKRHHFSIENVEQFLRARIPDFDRWMHRILFHIKKAYILHHYQTELRQCEIAARHRGVETLNKCLTLERIIKAIEIEDWKTVQVNISFL